LFSVRGPGYGPRVPRLVPLLAAAALLALPASASATTTVFGDDLSHGPFFSSSNLSQTNVIKPDGSADTGSPVSGVLVSVRIRTEGGGGSGVIRVLTEVSHPDATTYVFRNTPPEIPISVTPDVTAGGHVTETLTRRPIEADQRLGLHLDDPSGNIRATWNDNSLDPRAECAYTATPHEVDFDLVYTTFACNHNPILVQGTVESDTDGDGFGDDTQDGCPTNASTHGSCASTLPTPPPTKKKKKCKKKHKKRSAEAAKKKKCKKRKRR
jgi:hypothetical protein